MVVGITCLRLVPKNRSMHICFKDTQGHLHVHFWIVFSGTSMDRPLHFPWVFSKGQLRTIQQKSTLIIWPRGINSWCTLLVVAGDPAVGTLPRAVVSLQRLGWLKWTTTAISISTLSSFVSRNWSESSPCRTNRGRWHVSIGCLQCAGFSDAHCASVDMTSVDLTVCSAVTDTCSAFLCTSDWLHSVHFKAAAAGKPLICSQTADQPNPHQHILTVSCSRGSGKVITDSDWLKPGLDWCENVTASDLSCVQVRVSINSFTIVFLLL